VLLWDFGTYEPEGDPLEGWRKGKLSFVLRGKKLKGQWALARMRSDENKTPWLLIKTGETIKKISARAEDTSALSSLTMKQVAAGEAKRTWVSSTPTDENRTAPRRTSSKSAARLKQLRRT
jgi:bifunctional non-homologous end joining protein LigD